jgi:tetratricopeptide (TPR) repeat protein
MDQNDPEVSGASSKDISLNEIDVSIKQLEESKTYSSGVDVDDKCIDMHYQKGKVYYDEKKLKEAIEQFDKVLVADPNHIEAMFWKGNALQAQGNLDEAIEYYDKAIGIDPELPKIFISKALALQLKGIKTKSIDICNKAITCYNQALLLDPKNPDILINMGNTYSAMGQFDSAISCYKDALDINPHSTEALMNTGLVLQAQGDFKGALKQFNEAIMINPKNPNFHFTKAVILKRLQLYNPAVRAIIKCENLVESGEADWSGVSADHQVFIITTIEQMLKTTNGIKEIDTRYKDMYLQQMVVHKVSSGCSVCSLFGKGKGVKQPNFAISCDNVKKFITKNKYKENTFLNGEYSADKARGLLQYFDSINNELKSLKETVDALKEENKQLSSELNSKKNDYRSIFKTKYLCCVKPKSRGRLLHYFDGFMYTYESTLSVSNSLVSGQLLIDTGIGLKIASMLISLIPGIGSTVSENFATLSGFFMKMRILTRARKFIYRYSSGVDELVGSALSSNDMVSLMDNQVELLHGSEGITNTKVEILKQFFKNVEEDIYGAMYKMTTLDMGLKMLRKSLRCYLIRISVRRRLLLLWTIKLVRIWNMRLRRRYLFRR